MTRFHVVTKVPADNDPGNLAMATDVYLDPQAKGGSFSDPHERLAEGLGQPLLALYIQRPVFRLGEILVLDHNDRDQFGRKPSKWDVTIEGFVDPVAAVERVRQVLRDEEDRQRAEMEAALDDPGQT